MAEAFFGILKREELSHNRDNSEERLEGLLRYGLIKRVSKVRPIAVHITLDASAELRRGNAVIELVRPKKVSVERSINTENK